MKEKIQKPKPRMAIVVEDGIITDVFCDTKLDIEVLVMDQDEESDDPAVYSYKIIQVQPCVIRDLYGRAKKWFQKYDRLFPTSHATGSSLEAPPSE
jgi:hypothetical protein